jgi:hypothetical protein
MNSNNKYKDFRSKLTSEKLNKCKIQDKLQHRLVYIQKKLTTDANLIDKRNLDDGLMQFKRPIYLQTKKRRIPYRVKCVQRAIHILTTLKYKNESKRLIICSKYLQLLQMFLHYINIICVEIKKRLRSLKIPTNEILNNIYEDFQKNIDIDVMGEQNRTACSSSLANSSVSRADS